MVKLVTSIIAASALVISASAIDASIIQESASGVSLYEEAASEEASIAFMPEEEFASAAWEVEPVVEEEDTGLSLMAQLSNYIQNLIHPTSEEEQVEEAEDMNVNEATQQKNVKRMVGSARHRRQLNKRADGHQDDKGFWHYSVPRSKPSHTPAPGQNEASEVSPELEELGLELEVPEQNSVEMEAFPFFIPNIDVGFWDAIIPDKIKKEIASKVKQEIDHVVEHNTELKNGIEQASEFFGKASKVIDDLTGKHHTKTDKPPVSAPSPTPAA
ncbi:hypothetical protein K501DRAFT_265337 [Backusella circina FSU 941]|nr:hypothetical protein K501DRAFT_265337 [Backusella circina FSU 941]